MALAIAIAVGSTAAKGAEIRLGPRTDELVLEGIIERGDFEKLRSLIAEGTFGTDLFLASPGGDLGEAIKIGRLVRRLKLATIVPTGGLGGDITDTLIGRHGLKTPKNFVCASACFFIFVAGINRSRDFVGKPILGFHRPYLSREHLIGLSSDQAMSVASATRTVVEAYLRDMSVPTKYVDEMFSIGGDQIKWISNEDFEADFDGFIPELRDWVEAQCDKRTDDEKAVARILMKKTGQRTPAEKIMQDALMHKYSEQLKCQSELQAVLVLNAYRDERLATQPPLSLPAK